VCDRATGPHLVIAQRLKNPITDIQQRPLSVRAEWQSPGTGHNMQMDTDTKPAGGDTKAHKHAKTDCTLLGLPWNLGSTLYALRVTRLVWFQDSGIDPVFFLPSRGRLNRKPPKPSDRLQTLRIVDQTAEVLANRNRHLHLFHPNPGGDVSRRGVFISPTTSNPPRPFGGCSNMGVMTSAPPGNVMTSPAASLFNPLTAMY
jgi:hypothetical protein